MPSRHEGYSVEVQRDVIPVTTGGHHVPDPEWSYVDERGHAHAFDEEGELPTLRWVVTGTYWCDECRDDHGLGEWRCVECDMVVEPVYNFTGPVTVNVPGLSSYTLKLADGRLFGLTAEQAGLILADGDAAVAAIVKEQEEG